MYPAMRFGRSSAAAALIGLGLTFASDGALAQTEPPTAVKITEVLVEFSATLGDTITIRGANFDNGGDPVVTLGSDPAPLDIVEMPTGSEIVVWCPWGEAVPEAVPECVDGDFRLTVKTGAGATQTATYDLTIGAVGPQGEPGPQGPPGAGIAGQSCPEGEVVVGFETGGALICTPLSTGGGGGGGGDSLCEIQCGLASDICEQTVLVRRSNCAEQRANCTASGGSNCEETYQQCLDNVPDNCEAEKATCLQACPMP